MTISLHKERQRIDRKGADWAGIIGDAFALLIVFGIWLWQFETSEAGSLYHSLVVAIGIVGAIGVGLTGALMLQGIFTSRRD